jgi:hypothetical protein
VEDVPGSKNMERPKSSIAFNSELSLASANKIFIIIINMGVRASFRVPRLISRILKLTII